MNFLFGEVCGCSVREQDDSIRKIESSDEWEDIYNDMNQIAKVCHLLGANTADSIDLDFLVLGIARKHFAEGGDMRMRFSYPSLITEAIKLTSRYGELKYLLKVRHISLSLVDEQIGIS